MKLVSQALYAGWGLIHRQYLAPTLKVASLAEAKIPDGVKLLILDKDNCFARPHELQVHPLLREKWRSLVVNYQVAVLSNTAGDATHDPSDNLRQELERTLGVHVLKHEKKKPMCYNEVLECIAAYGRKLDEVCIVGDRIFTDVLMANLLGAKSVYIYPGLHPSWINKAEYHVCRWWCS